MDDESTAGRMAPKPNGTFLALGMLAGTAIGLMTDTLALGAGCGLVFGIVIDGLRFDRARRLFRDGSDGAVPTP